MGKGREENRRGKGKEGPASQSVFEGVRQAGILGLTLSRPSAWKSAWRCDKCAREGQGS